MRTPLDICAVAHTITTQKLLVTTQRQQQYEDLHRSPLGLSLADYRRLYSSVMDLDVPLPPNETW